jgi:hypothetical protein
MKSIDYCSVENRDLWSRNITRLLAAYKSKTRLTVSQYFETCGFETSRYDRGMNESPSRPPGRPRSEASRAAILDAAYWQVMRRG